MGSIQYYTEEGLRKLKEELQFLKTKGRTDIAKQIAEARDKGDLSENAEYDAAKDKIRIHILQFNYLLLSQRCTGAFGIEDCQT